MEYSDCIAYLATAQSNKDKIAKIDALIVALEDAAVKAAVNEDVTEYSLDDGQTKIKKVFRGGVNIARAINDFERIRQRYINRLNGYGVQLIDRESNKL